MRGPRRRLRPAPSDGARVELVEAGIGTDGALIDAAVAAGARGVVVAATGAGNTSPLMLAAAERAMRDGVAVVLASRCPAGAVSTAYAFPGGGATWVRAGAIPAGTLARSRRGSRCRSGWRRASIATASRRLMAEPGRLTDHAAGHAHHGPYRDARGREGFGWVEAIGIRDGRIAFAGSEVYLETRADPFTRADPARP